MTPARDEHAIDTLPRLEALLGPLSDASVHKELPYVHPAYRAMIAASPFAVLATTGPGGLDASPRGDPAGFVQLLDDKTLLLPERRGNNRADSLRNIVADPRVALLFLIPGVGETLRVNGHARISVAPDLLARFVVNGQPPKCVIVVDPRTAAVLRFVLQLVNERGQVDAADVQALRDQGVNDEQIVEIVAHVALNLFTNYVNVALGVPVDFPGVKLRPAR